MIALFTDFGSSDIYVGQMKARLQHLAPSMALVDLAHDVPAFAIEEAAHLLAALFANVPEAEVWVAVVDPGVGSERGALALQVDGRWLVGPDNGLLAVVAARAQSLSCFDIVWSAADAAVSFHGRDLFAPIAAFISRGDHPEDYLHPRQGLQVELSAAELARVIYVDHYGNVLTGLRAHGVPVTAQVLVGGHEVAYARVFAEAPAGRPFWYVNGIGLVEIAWPQGSAALRLGVAVGAAVLVRE